MFSNKTVVIQPFPGVKKQPLPASAAKHRRDGTIVHYEVCQQLLFQIVIDIIEHHQDEQDILTVHQNKKQGKLKLPKPVSGVLSSTDHHAQHLIILRPNISATTNMENSDKEDSDENSTTIKVVIPCFTYICTNLSAYREKNSVVISIIGLQIIQHI